MWPIEVGKDRLFGGGGGGRLSVVPKGPTGKCLGQEGNAQVNERMRE